MARRERHEAVVREFMTLGCRTGSKTMVQPMTGVHSTVRFQSKSPSQFLPWGQRQTSIPTTSSIHSLQPSFETLDRNCSPFRPDSPSSAHSHPPAHPSPSSSPCVQSLCEPQTRLCSRSASSVNQSTRIPRRLANNPTSRHNHRCLLAVYNTPPDAVSTSRAHAPPHKLIHRRGLDSVPSQLGRLTHPATPRLSIHCYCACIFIVRQPDLETMPPSTKRSQRVRRETISKVDVPDSSPSRPAKRRKKAG